MTTIQITEDVRITTDSVCVTIERRIRVDEGKHAGEYRWPSVGFYGDVKTACLALLGRHIGLVSSLPAQTDLRAVVTAIDLGTSAIVEAVRNATKAANPTETP